ncbi:sterile alpha motif domain-containing protein 10a isoform 1-T1 [Menidia menidia]
MAVDAASSFSFCRPAVEYRALPEDFKHQLSRRTGGNLTWHDGRGQKTAGGRTVKLLQQPGTEPLQQQLRDISHQSNAAKPVPPCCAVVTTRCLQMAEETLSSQLSDLRGGILPACHHRPGVTATEWGEAAEDGLGARDAATGAAATGAAAPGAGGGTQPAAAQQRYFWKYFIVGKGGIEGCPIILKVCGIKAPSQQ